MVKGRSPLEVLLWVLTVSGSQGVQESAAVTSGTYPANEMEAQRLAQAIALAARASDAFMRFRIRENTMANAAQGAGTTGGATDARNTPR